MKLFDYFHIKITSMKKTILIILSALVCQISVAQKCKFDIDKADPFTGKRNFSIRPDLARGWAMSIGNAGGNYEIGVSVLVGGVTKNVINKGDTLLMALESGLPIVLRANSEYLPASNVAGTSVYTSYSAMYSISKEELMRLGQKKMTALRMFAGATPYNVEVKEKNAEKISKAATCVASEQ
jgi:hypothetical protein